jgi:hypothetical protein
MWDGQMHGSESLGSEIGYLFAEWLLTSDRDQTAREILERNYVVMIPIINIDTYNRQNMRRTYTFPNGSTFNIPYGVNLNRNFVHHWGELGTSDWNSSTEYRGLYAGSEPETQAMRNAYQTFKPKFYVNTHQGGGPWLGHYYADKDPELDEQTLNLIAQLSQQMNVTTYRNQPVGAGGTAVADAGATYNASAWLIELDGPEMPKVNETTIADYYYPRSLSILLAMCKLSEDTTVPEFTFDMSILLAAILSLALAVIPIRKLQHSRR